ncbi:MMPL family transporter [Gordonia hongkongensis]|uniref:MMPL family transporter n=1 Tax=Gordonia hongkongensis TaxID=1701090 RepID=A0AAX3T5S5_9ACTN|nr:MULTISPECIES: MMPL family transporter [Gordonia]MCT1355456.1 MMPL family transporter [Gordonia sp. p3-SID1431]QIK46465.1 MMPL family transporter [Gordonia terrae]WFP24542.1 MMPL family transporter [Gordonia hongkongensis]
MASFLFKLGSFCFRHKWSVIAAWLAALIAVTGLVGALQPKFAQDFSLPGTDSGVATEQVEQYFPQVMAQQEQASTSILVAAEDGLQNHTAQLNELAAALRGLPDVIEPQTVVNPLTVAAADPALAAQAVGDNGRVGLIQVRQDIPILDLTVENKEELVSILDEFSVDGLQVEATGSLMQVMEAGGTAELLGFAVAFVVMIVAFGALIAAFIPLVTAIVSVGITILLLTLSAEALSINESATAIVTMLGIAVSIDYALFIVSRYRAELLRGGAPSDAIGRAVGTAGSAVVFAGLTVIVAVVALMVIGIPIITQMGAGAGVAVFIAVLAALTLIPAILGAFGRFAFLPRIPWIKHAAESEDDTLGVKVGRTVVKWPIPFIVIGLLALAAAAIPATKLELGLSLSSEAEAPAQELLSRGFGEGINGPLLVVVHDEDGAINAAAEETVRHIATLSDVANPEGLTFTGNRAGDTALIMVTPESAPSSAATHDLMEQIRAFAPTVENRGAELHVGGQTAIMSDLSQKLDDALIPYLVVVVGLAFLIMIGVFRSLWVPLIGTLGFVFSVLATFGVTVAIFQEGWLGLITHTQPIISFLPIFLIGVVFGLAMDYQVFLVTRMREEFMHGLSAKEAIVAGYRHGARVVTSAAIIMISVFAAFMLSPETTAKMMGFALAAAVFFDAFVIRMLVVPAAIALLGDRAWGLPRWLDRFVINFDIEGEAVRHRGLEEPDDTRSPVPAS